MSRLLWRLKAAAHVQACSQHPAIGVRDLEEPVVQNECYKIGEVADPRARFLWATTGIAAH